MRKRSKKRVPQDIKAWRRVVDVEDEKFYLITKKTARWTSGSHRDWNSRVLNNAKQNNTVDLLRNTLSIGLSNKKLSIDTQTALKKIATQKANLPKMRSLAKYKNFCLFSGKGRTYNRILLIARHQTRKLINIGALSGISK